MTSTDLDGNGTNNPSADRIRYSFHAITNVNGTIVRETSTYACASNGSAASNLISVTHASVDGLRSWSANFGRTNHTGTFYAGSGNRYVTNYAPDGALTLSYFQHGQLKTVTRKDGAGGQLSQTTYTYDAHGRQRTVTDARNGTTTYSYDDGDRVASVTTPVPGTGGSGQTTSYTYDHARRITRSTLPDGAGVTNVYSLRGELRTNYGARVYPVAYSYDAQGRRTNMTTWKDYASSSGAATQR